MLSFLTLLIPYGLLVARFWYVNDDAYISFRYARNLVRGLGLRYNPAENPPLEGYSNFLWTLMAAPVLAFGGDPAAWMPAFSAACGACLLWLVYRRLLLQGVSIPSALLATLLLAVFPPFALWSSTGLETMPFALLVFAAFDRLVLREAGPDAIGGAALLILLSLIRVDGAAWAVAVLLAALGARLLRNPRQAWPLLPAALVWAAAYAAYSAWRWTYFGTLVPSTVLAKSALDGPRLLRGLNYVVSYGLTFLTPLALIPGAVAALRLRRLWIGVPTVVMAGMFPAYSVLVTGDFMPMGRFLLPGMPFIALLWGWLLQDLWDSGRRALRVLAMSAAGVAAVLGLLPGWNVHLIPRRTLERVRFRFNEKQFATEYESWLRQTERVRNWAALGRSLRQYAHARPLEDDAPSVVLPWIGAAGYYSDLHVFDQFGLVSLPVARRPVASGEPLMSPGHDKYVSPDFFLPQRPTILNAMIVVSSDHREAARAMAQFGHALVRLEPQGGAARLYCPDFAPAAPERQDSNELLTYVVTWVRIPQGVSARACWEDFEHRLRVFADSGDVGAPIWAR